MHITHRRSEPRLGPLSRRRRLPPRAPLHGQPRKWTLAVTFVAGSGRRRGRVVATLKAGEGRGQRAGRGGSVGRFQRVAGAAVGWCPLPWSSRLGVGGRRRGGSSRPAPRPLRQTVSSSHATTGRARCQLVTDRLSDGFRSLTRWRPSPSAGVETRGRSGRWVANCIAGGAVEPPRPQRWSPEGSVCDIDERLCPKPGRISVVPEVQDPLLSTEEVARQLSLAVPKVWSLAASGKLRSARGVWPLRFRRADVESYAAQGSAGRPAPPEGPRASGSHAVGRHRPSAPGGGGSRETLSVTEAAALLGVGQASLRRYISNGDLGLVGSPPRLRRRDLYALIERCRIEPGQLTHLDPNARRRAADREPPLTQNGNPDRRYGRR